PPASVGASPRRHPCPVPAFPPPVPRAPPLGPVPLSISAAGRSPATATAPHGFLVCLRIVTPHLLQTFPTRFSATRRYFFSFSIPITFDAPKSSPASSMVPDPQKQSR